MAASPIALGDFVLDPARVQKLIDPEFVADVNFLVFANDRGRFAARYDALPASLADDPSVVGFFCGKGELASSALVAVTGKGGVLEFQELSPSVVVGTSTVAGRGGDAIASPEGHAS